MLDGTASSHGAGFAAYEEMLRKKKAADDEGKTNSQSDTAASPIECASLEPIGASKLPPRRWAYGSFLLFGSAAVLGAVDGGGKGAIAIATALAFITGKPLLGERVWRTGRVAVVTYEDDEAEWHRRIAAACMHYELDYEAVIQNIYFLRKPGERICFTAMKAGEPVFPDGNSIIKQLKDKNIAFLIVDPFNHAHMLEDGNNNVMIAKVAAELSRVAEEAEVAALVLHHLRKGSNGNPDDLMGATSLRATFRSCRILSRMAPEVAEKMQIPDPWRYIRIAGSKENYAPPPEKATWFRLAGVPLGNATAEYPDGDDVAVATTWQPRPLFENMDVATLRAVFAALRDTIHGAARQGKHLPWAGTPLMEIGQRSDREASRIIGEWLKSGTLTKAEHYLKERNNTVDRVVLVEEKAAAILAEIEHVSAPPA